MKKQTNKLKRILVATDFSDHSQFAILRAIDLAAKMKACLTILHIVEKGFLEKMMEKLPIIGKVMITPEEYAASVLKKQIAALSDNKIKINYSIIQGDFPAKKIIKYAKENKIDLLVMGAHGKYSIHDWFVGTTAEFVAKKTCCPVLIIKRASKKSYQKILVPVDFSTASKQALLFAVTLFPNKNFRLLHVGDHEYEDLLKKEGNISKEKVKTLRDSLLSSLKDKTKNFIKSLGKKFTKIPMEVKLGYPGVVIIDEAKKSNQDLMIMGTEGHSQSHYLFIGRVANRVLIEIDRDILLVPPKNKK
jgi:nucleotide-binding universal stress UspA family protein